MLSAERLKFAAIFPFSGTARQFLEETGFSFPTFPEEAKKAAALRFAAALEKKALDTEGLSNDLAALKAHILSYPAARMMASLSKSRETYSSFAYSTALTCHDALKNSSNGFELSVSLLKGQGIPFTQEPSEDNAVRIRAHDFLANYSLISPKLYTLSIA